MGHANDVERGRSLRRIWVGLAAGLWIALLVDFVNGVRDVRLHGYASAGLWLNVLRSLTDPLPANIAMGALIGGTAGLLWAIARWIRPGGVSRGPATAWIGMLALVPIVAAVGLIAGGRLWAKHRAAADPNRHNVVLLLVDTLRADRLGVYGHVRDTSATIDRLAAEATLFTRAVSPADKTRTVMASLWTGLYPSRHGVFGRTDGLSLRFHTAAELAREAGYRTAAFAPNPSLDRDFGHAQGWDLYVDRELRNEDCHAAPAVCFETAKRIQTLALDWLDAAPDRPFLLWMHYRDVHGPYVPPPPYDQMFQAKTRRPLSPSEIGRRQSYLDLPNDGDDLNHYLDRYDGEIRYTDDRIAEFLFSLDERGLLDRTVIVLAADHGEEFLDHGGWNHGRGVFEEMLHVPLIIRWPGAPARIETRVVSTLALFPTVLHAMGIEPPPSDGVDLVPLVRDGAPTDLPERVFAEAWGGKLRAVREGDWKQISYEEGGRFALYNLARDPGEREDLSQTEVARAAALREELVRFGEAVESGADVPTVTIELGDELRKRLEVLGYIE